MVEKMPNWLRYILAIPFGIICLILGYYIGYFSNLYVSSPDSIMMKLYIFLYQNGINVIIMCTAMNYILPKYKFQFTLTISIILCALEFVGLGMTILSKTLTLSYIIGLILTIGCFIFECIFTFKEAQEANTEH